MSNSNINKAVTVLQQGGVIAYPTEAVFGLGCDPQQRESIQKLLDIKQREKEKGLILIASDVSQIMPYIDISKLSDAMWNEVQSSWPGPVTWLIPANKNVSEMIRGKHESVAVRVTAHPLVKKLCTAFAKAIISTSANRSHQPPGRTADEVRNIFADQLDYVLDGELGKLNKPTEIRDAVSGNIIRPSK